MGEVDPNEAFPKDVELFFSCFYLFFSVGSMRFEVELDDVFVVGFLLDKSCLAELCFLFEALE